MSGAGRSWMASTRTGVRIMDLKMLEAFVVLAE